MSNRWSTKDFQGSGATLYATIMVYTCYYTFVQVWNVQNQRVNLNVNSGLWMIMLCQCIFMSCNKHTTLVLKVDSEEAVFGGVRKYLGTLCFPLNFVVNLKLLQK